MCCGLGEVLLVGDEEAAFFGDGSHRGAQTRGLIMPPAPLRSPSAHESLLRAPEWTDDDDDVVVLGDAWAYDVGGSYWVQLPSLPAGFARSRAALAVCRDQLLLSGGCAKTPFSETGSSFRPGEGFDDLWVPAKRLIKPSD